MLLRNSANFCLYGKKEHMKIGALNYNRANPSEKIEAAAEGGGGEGGLGRGVALNVEKLV